MGKPISKVIDLHNHHHKLQFSCPSYLDSIAQKEWRRIIPLLEEFNILSNLDLVTVAGYCQAFSFWVRASELFMEQGLFLPGDDGLAHLNPLYHIVRSSGDTLMKTSAQLGMNPVSRAELKKGRGKKQ